MVFGWRERRWNETAQLSLSIGLRPWISFPSEGVAASLRGNSLRSGERVGRCMFIWRGLGRRQYAEREQMVLSSPSNQSGHGISREHKNTSICGRSPQQQEGDSAKAQVKFSDCLCQPGEGSLLQASLLSAFSCVNKLLTQVVQNTPGKQLFFNLQPFTPLSALTRLLLCLQQLWQLHQQPALFFVHARQ